MSMHKPHPEETSLTLCGLMIDEPRQRVPKRKADESKVDCRYCLIGMADPTMWDECIHERVDGSAR